ncbi:MAG: hypothetical protein EBT83_18370, partial [Betaproteobacteria bacterium]|nr:hypothetical protein [Betaproteobacteria bacterium]
RACTAAGVDGILIFPPYYPGDANDEGMFAYYRDTAAATKRGVIIYSRDHANFSPAAVAKGASMGPPGRYASSTGRSMPRCRQCSLRVPASRTDASFGIMARTDALAVEGLNAAIERACRCVEAGADMIFPEAMTELAMYRTFVDAVRVPVLANITEFGATPLFTLDELRDAGVSIALYPLSAFRAMNQAALNVFETIRHDGTQQAVVDRMQSRTELYQHLDYHAYETKLDALFAKGNQR